MLLINYYRYPFIHQCIYQLLRLATLMISFSFFYLCYFIFHKLYLHKSHIQSFIKLIKTYNYLWLFLCSFSWKIHQNKTLDSLQLIPNQLFIKKSTIHCQSLESHVHLMSVRCLSVPNEKHSYRKRRMISPLLFTSFIQGMVESLVDFFSSGAAKNDSCLGKPLPLTRLGV